MNDSRNMFYGDMDYEHFFLIFIVILILFLIGMIIFEEYLYYRNKMSVIKFSQNEVILNPKDVYNLRNVKRGRKIISNQYDFSGLYVIVNESKRKYFISESSTVLNRCYAHFYGNGSASIKRDYYQKDKFSIEAFSHIHCHTNKDKIIEMIHQNYGSDLVSYNKRKLNYSCTEQSVALKKNCKEKVIKKRIFDIPPATIFQEPENSKSTVHFGVNVKNIKYSLKLKREEFALIKTKPSFGSSQSLADLGAYTDNTCSEYSLDWCEDYRKLCMKNYDLNMQYFKSLDKKDFEKSLHSFLNKYGQFETVTDLKEWDKKSGFYMMVLDEYNQVYIGKSDNIKRRIQQHWSNTKSFDRTLWPMYEWKTSCFSIDFFRALDTTRIFAWECNPNGETEDKLISNFPKAYVTNRIGGGISNALLALASKNEHLSKFNSQLE